jgi:hypothetical protein
MHPWCVISIYVLWCLNELPLYYVNLNGLQDGLKQCRYNPTRSKLVSHSNKKYIQGKKIQTTKGHSTQSQNETHNDIHSSS